MLITSMNSNININWLLLKIKKLLFHPATIWILVLGIIVVGACLLASMVHEFRSPNYGFYGTHYDFLAFYTAGYTALHHNISQLYNAAMLTGLQRHIIPHPVGATGYMPFLNPPFMAALLAPLALVNINTARLFWLGTTVLLSVFILYLLTDHLKIRQRYLAIGLLLLTFPMYQAFVEGQLSILVLLGGCLSYLFFTRQQKIWSGASLVLLWIMPQFGVFALAGLLIKRQWTMLKGWAIASAVVGLTTLPFTGLNIYFTYIRVLASTTGNHFIDMTSSALLTWRGAVNLSMGINGFYSALIGQNHVQIVNLLYFVTAAGLVGYLLKTVLATGLKVTKEQALRLLIASILTGVLIDPHLFAQDIVVVYLIIPLLCALYIKESFKTVVLLATTCDLVLLDQYSRVHFSTLITFVTAICFITQSIKLSKTV